MTLSTADVSKINNLYVDSIRSGYKLVDANVTYAFGGVSTQSFPWNVTVAYDFANVTLTDDVETVGEAWDSAISWGMSATIVEMASSLSGVIEEAMLAISSYANITFSGIDFNNSLNIQPDTIFYEADLPVSGAGFAVRGAATMPYAGAAGSTIVWMDKEFEASLVPDPSNPTSIANLAATVDGGKQALYTAIHEILHSLGFQHPGDNFLASLPAELDKVQYTVMSYNGSNTGLYGWSMTPMALDIAALQDMYGATKLAEDDTQYSWIAAGANYDTEPNDGYVGIGRGYYCIWDTDGFDAIDFSRSPDRALINLNSATLQGSDYQATVDLVTALTRSTKWSSLPSVVKAEFEGSYIGTGGYLSTTIGLDDQGNTILRPGGFTIANGAVIENALGGSADDILLGNTADNILSGGDGDDFIFGYDGSDLIFGGEGDDELDGGSGPDGMSGGVGRDTILIGDGDRAYGDSGDDQFVVSGPVISGSAINGGAGYDTLFASVNNLGLVEHSMTFLWQYGYLGNLTVKNLESYVLVTPGDTEEDPGVVTTVDAATLGKYVFEGGDADVTRFDGGFINSAWKEIRHAWHGEGDSAPVFQATLPDYYYAVSGTINDLEAYFYAPDGQRVDLVAAQYGNELELSLPWDFKYDLDRYQIGNFLQITFVSFSYWQASAYPGEDPYLASANISAFVGIENGYDHGLTAITSPAGFIIDDSGEFSYQAKSDSREVMHPVSWSLLDDHHGTFKIDPSTGILSLFASHGLENDSDFTLTIRADDGITIVDKTINVLLQPTGQVAPVLNEASVSDVIMAQAGSLVGQWIPNDANEATFPATPDHYRIDMETISGREALLAVDENWNIYLARDPHADEMGVSLNAELTVIDSTGLESTTTIEFTISDADMVITSPNDDFFFFSDAMYEGGGTYIVHGGGGNDHIVLQNTPGKAYGGSGNDTIYAIHEGVEVDGGHGNDLFYKGEGAVTIIGGEGQDTIWIGVVGFFDGRPKGEGTIVYNDLAESHLTDYVLGSQKTGAWDTIRFGGTPGDSTVIDLSALGAIEWKDSAVGIGSMWAVMSPTGARSSDLLIDDDRDGDFDFGISFEWMGVDQPIHFTGLGDWVLEA